MADNAFDETLTGFRGWAETTERELAGDPADDIAELITVFGLMPDYLGIAAPAELTAGNLNDLLLSVYPRKITVLDRADTAFTIPAMRDLTAYLADAGTITPGAAQALARELDKVEPDFADAVMNPDNWGLATAMMHAMHGDGVDISDSAAVDQWIARQNAGVFHGEGFAGHEADPLTWDGVNLKESFGIPNVLAPIRLPDEAALTALAAAAPLLADLRGLAQRVRGTTVRAAEADPPVLMLATETGLVKQDGDTLVPGDDAESLDDLTGHATVLEKWARIFACVLDTTLAAADRTKPHVGGDLDLTGHGIAMVADLFLSGRAGVPVTQLSASLRSAAVAEVPPDAAGPQWEEWTGAHGDPARLLLGQLARLSAVTIADEVAHLEPLALFAVAAKLRACGASVPELPPPGEMTADDVVLVSMFGTEDDLEAEFASWVAERTPQDAARELLAFAAGGSAGVRTAAVQLVSRLGDPAEPAWREVLDRPELRCYAKPALLTLLADRDPESPVPPELKLAAEDLAWFVADSFAPLTHIDLGNSTFPFDMAELTDGGWTVSHETLFEAMARLGHPDALAVLTMLGKHSDDKKTAKAARRAAFKAASRLGSRRR
jgi:hypothetical protein